MADAEEAAPQTATEEQKDAVPQTEAPVAEETPEASPAEGTAESTAPQVLMSYINIS